MSKVSRSTYQKMSEKYKSLLRDMYTICMHPVAWESIEVRRKWTKVFKEQEEFNALLKDIATKYIKEHPEYDIMKWKSNPPPDKKQ